MQWVQLNRERIAKVLGSPQPALKKKKAEKVRSRVKASQLYHEYVQQSEIGFRPYDFADLVECSPDAKNEVVQSRFDDLRAKVQLLNDSKLLEFLVVCGAAHADMLVE